MAPDALVDHVAWEHLVRVAQQQLEQALLGAGEVERAVAAAGAVVREVEFEVAISEALAFVGVGRGATQQRAHAGVQLIERERLDEVVVGTGVEARDAVADRVAGGQHQDRRAVAPLAHPPADGQAVEAWHRDVEHDRVEVSARELVQRFSAVCGAFHVIALDDERAPQRAGECWVVVHDQELVGSPLHRWRLSAVS